MEVGDYYPVCNCGGYDELKYLGLAEEYVTSNMFPGPWHTDGKTNTIYAAFATKHGGVLLAEPVIRHNGMIAFMPVGGSETLTGCSKRLTYRLKK